LQAKSVGRALGPLGLVILCIGCAASITSRENDGYISVIEDINDYDSPPMLVTAVRPRYPDMAREVGAGGRVLLKVLVLENGTLGAVQVIESPNPILVDEAITALRKSLFAPATRGGVPVKATMVVPFVFETEHSFSHRSSSERSKPGQSPEIQPPEPSISPEDLANDPGK
jgi:TonB family protein